MTTELILENESETLSIGRQIAERLRKGDKIALSGTLGAGKTTFARGVLEGLGFSAEVPSPTFAIVQQYDPPEVTLSLAHVDLYRIENGEEISELGLDENLIDGAMIVEWPDRMPDRFWDEALQLQLEIIADGNRRLTWTAGTAWKGRWPPQ